MAATARILFGAEGQCLLTDHDCTQLGRMLVEAAHRLNVKTLILDAPGAPAKQINALHEHVDGSFASADSIREIAGRCDVLTYEIEHIDTNVLEELASAGTVEVANPWMPGFWGTGLRMNAR